LVSEIGLWFCCIRISLSREVIAATGFDGVYFTVMGVYGFERCVGLPVMRMGAGEGGGMVVGWVGDEERDLLRISLAMGQVKGHQKPTYFWLLALS
jgi:hypothetical protein